MPEDIPPPVDFGWFAMRQYDHLLNVVNKPGGMDLITSLCATVRARVDVCREMRLSPGRTVRQVMAQTRGGFPGIGQADLIPITRGILTAIF